MSASARLYPSKNVSSCIRSRETASKEFYRKGRKCLNVIIIGAGIGGLALAGVLGHSGHKVVVLEAAPCEIGEVGVVKPTTAGLDVDSDRLELAYMQRQI